MKFFLLWERKFGAKDRLGEGRLSDDLEVVTDTEPN